MTLSMQDPLLFYAISFFAFLVLAYAFGRKPFVGWLDNEIAKIRSELDTASTLRAEAEVALLDCKHKQSMAEKDAKLIIAKAKEQVEAMRRQAEIDLKTMLARQQQLAAERIQRAEAEAVADIRAAAVRMGMDLARQTLTEKLSEADAAKLVDQAIAEISTLKAKATKAA